MKTDPGQEVEIRADDQLLDVNGHEKQGGQRYNFSIPEDASMITVSLLSPDGERRPSWSLRLADRPPAWQGDEGLLKNVEKLRQLRRTAPRKEQGFILRSFAVLSRARGDDEQQESFLLQAIAADRNERHIRGEANQVGLLASLYLEQGRFSDARRILSDLQPPPGAPAEAHYWKFFYEGLLAQHVGDYRTALDHVRKAVDQAERVGMSFQFHAEQALAYIYQELGLFKKALDITARSRAQADKEGRKKDCGFGDLLTNQGWSQLRARDGGQNFGDPRPPLEEAKAIYDSNDCRTEQRFNARLNLAFAYLQANQPRQARRELAEAGPLDSEGKLEQRLWRFDLEGRTAIAEGRLEQALGFYDRLAEMAESALSLDGRFRAFLGRAKARLALGQRTEALAALDEADRLLDQQIWLIPLHEGRDTFLAQRDEATRLFLQLLLEDWQTQRAFELARQSRSRLLRQLRVKERLAQLSQEEQERWDQALSNYRALRNLIDQQTAEEWRIHKGQKERAREVRAEELVQAGADLDRAMADLGRLEIDDQRDFSPPGRGEVILAYHPLPQEGKWVGFAAHGQGIEFKTFDLPADEIPPAKQAQILLEPFYVEIQASERVRVLPYGRLWTFDFHALPFADEPLLAKRLVVYSLDLPPGSSSVASEKRVALLVADPQSNLAAARKEGKMVSKAIRGWGPGWTLKSLKGLEATPKALRDELPETFLFHYAGHGLFEGEAGWDSVLLLARKTHLTLDDILTLPQAPTWVVLSACDGGLSSERAPGTGIGLAQAFVVSGAQVVIAATRKVDDSAARELAEELYSGSRPETDLAHQFQRAQLAYRARHPQAKDWASFRVLTP